MTLSLPIGPRSLKTDSTRVGGSDHSLLLHKTEEIQMSLGLRAAGIEMSLIPVSVRYLRTSGLAYLPVENET